MIIKCTYANGDEVITRFNGTPVTSPGRREGKRMKLSLCIFEGHKIYRLITDNNIFIGLQVDNEPVVFPDVEEAKKFIKTLK